VSADLEDAIDRIQHWLGAALAVAHKVLRLQELLLAHAPGLVQVDVRQAQLQGQPRRTTMHAEPGIGMGCVQCVECVKYGARRKHTTSHQTKACHTTPHHATRHTTGAHLSPCWDVLQSPHVHGGP